MYKARIVTTCLALALMAASRPSSAQDRDSTATDSLLVEELARELQASAEAVSAASTSSSARPPRSLMNPEISVIGDFRTQYYSEGDRNVDAEIHEVETAFRSAVDPYARADVYVSIHGEDGEFEFELEEAYLTTLSLPYQLQLKAGKFRSAFGKINRIHPHALPYIGLPAAYRNFLGEEGLNDQGLSLSWLVPNPRFFQELIFEVTRGPGENASFATDEGNALLYTGRLRNFWDLSADATLEVGFSGAAGPNDTGQTSWLGGIDLTYIWKPLQFNVYRSLTLQGEAIFSRRDTDSEVIRSWGAYALASYRFARRWLTTARLDVTNGPDNPDLDEHGISLTVGWLASEFQKIELGLQTVDSDVDDRSLQAVVRAVFVIGTHGAHEY